MVRCTGSWPPVQRGGGTPPQHLGFLPSPLPWVGITLCSPKHTSPPPPHPPPAKEGFLGCGRAQKTSAEMGEGGAGYVTLYPAFGLFLTSGFQELEEGRKEKRQRQGGDPERPLAPHPQPRPPELAASQQVLTRSGITGLFSPPEGGWW